MKKDEEKLKTLNEKLCKYWQCFLGLYKRRGGKSIASPLP